MTGPGAGSDNQIDESDFSTRLQRWQARIQWVAQIAPLVAFAIVQRPGWIVPDTKLDLTANPGAFLARALSLWDPMAAGGQLQNQAYGYLFPMGPFFWAGKVVGLPAWLTQRLWWALVLVTAFVGMRLLLTRLGVGSHLSRIVAAYAFALAPRMLIGLGAISSEIWPMALAPWVLLPLVRVGDGGERAAALRSGLAVLAIGAVNAAATLAALVPAVIWILSRGRRHRWRLAGWWSLAVVLASSWWIGPLLLMGRYSPPFLNWIEKASVTTQPASVTEASRGTTQWLAGLVTEAGPIWPSGFQVLTQRPAVLLGLMVVALGLLGIWWAHGPWTGFARTSLVVGLVLVTLGHTGALNGAFSAQVATLLDGPLAPFRNTHKFEPAVRIALVVGLAHALPRLQAAARLLRAPWPRLGYVVVGLCILGQAASPALAGVSQRGPYLAVPPYWQATADYLEAHDAGGRTLVLPGINGVATIWGSPRDEPLQPFARSPWITRDGVPLGSASATRLLNEIENRVSTGSGGAALRDLLDRLAISHVILRSDLVTGSGAVPMSVLKNALVSAGLESVRSEGPLIGAPTEEGQIFDYGMTTGSPAVEIFAVPSAETIVAPALVPAAEVVVVAGGPEGVSAGAVQGRAAVLSHDSASVEVLRSATASPPPVIVTDTLQRRVANFGEVRDNYGPLLEAGEPYPGSPDQHDWLPAWLGPLDDDALADLQTTADPLNGVVARASSSLGTPDFTQGRDLATGPERAFDRSRETAWESSGFNPVGQWVELTWPTPIDLPERLPVVFDMDQGAAVTGVEIEAGGETVRTYFEEPLSRTARKDLVVTTAAVPAGPATELRLTVIGVGDHSPTVRVRDIGNGSIPRAELSRSVPGEPTSAQTSFSFEALKDRHPHCTTSSESVVLCNPVLGRAGEESGALRRNVTQTRGGEFTISGTALPYGTPNAARLLQRLDGVHAVANSTWIEGPWVSAPLAVDGDPRTYWAAQPEAEASPSLRLVWSEPRVISGVSLETSLDVPGRRPTRVAIEVNGERFIRGVPTSGVINLPDQTATSMRVTVLSSAGPDTLTWQGVHPLPVVVGELTPIGPTWAPSSSAVGATVAVPCGLGPDLVVNNERVPTRASGTRGQYIAGEAMRWEACETVDVPAGPLTIHVTATGEFEALTVEAIPTQQSSGEETSPRTGVEVGTWSNTERKITIEGTTTSDSFLIIRENANAGWTATLGNEQLAPITIDGWAQAWLVPRGSSGEVSLSFTPQRLYVVGLGGGLMLALVLVGLAVASRGRVSRPPVVEAAELPAAVTVGGLVLAAGALLSWIGLVIVGILAGAFRFLRWQHRGVIFAILATLWVGWAAWEPWPAGSHTNRDGLSQVLAFTVIMIGVGVGGGLARPLSHPGDDRALDEVPAEGGDDEGQDTGGA